MNISIILLGLIIFISVFVCIGSFIYFIKVKTKYRWIKLFWGLQISVYLLIMIWTILGGVPSKETQFITNLLPLTALAYGLVSAFARQKEAELIQKIENKLNGEFEQWVSNLLNTMPDKRK